jgi:hypothetical protein
MPELVRQAIALCKAAETAVRGGYAGVESGTTDMAREIVDQAIQKFPDDLVLSKLKGSASPLTDWPNILAAMRIVVSTLTTAEEEKKQYAWLDSVEGKN